MAKSIASHSTTAQATKAQKAQKARTTKAKTVTVNATTGKGYQQFSGQGSRPHFAGYTIAIAAESGLITISKAGTLTRARTFRASSLALWFKACGPTMAGYWKRSGYADSTGGITSEGLKNLQNRINGEGPYKTSLEIVNKMREAIRNGGTHEIDGCKYAFGSSVSSDA